MPTNFGLLACVRWVAAWTCASVALAGGISASPWAERVWSDAPALLPAPELPNEEGVRALCFEGVPWRGKPTRVFAYYGFPAGAGPQARVPGIVLVHGGGGTAFASWVRLWTARGYAAIALDHSGSIPVGKSGAWSRLPDGGPGHQTLGGLDAAPEDQWMYHAVANTLRAHSLLRSFPEVDAGRIGITGISWGGVITATAASLDTRFKFAAPVYGCGFLTEGFDEGSQFVGRGADPEKVRRWRQLWDPARYLATARLPMLWTTGTNDFAFTLKALRRSYETAPGPHSLSVRLRMPHGHGGPGESPEEIRVFADSVVKGGTPLLKISGQRKTESLVTVDYESPVPLRSAELNTTHGLGWWQNRYWHTTAARIDASGRRVSATLPAGAAIYYFNLIDERGLIVSSEHRTVTE